MIRYLLNPTWAELLFAAALINATALPFSLVKMLYRCGAKITVRCHER